MEHQYSSILLERAVGEFAKLPGIGRKTALRLVLHMLRRPVGEAEAFAEAVSTLCREVKYCKVCHNIWIVMCVNSVRSLRATRAWCAWWRLCHGGCSIRCN